VGWGSGGMYTCAVSTLVVMIDGDEDLVVASGIEEVWLSTVGVGWEPIIATE